MSLEILCHTLEITTCTRRDFLIGAVLGFTSRLLRGQAQADSKHVEIPEPPSIERTVTTTPRIEPVEVREMQQVVTHDMISPHFRLQEEGTDNWVRFNELEGDIVFDSLFLDENGHIKLALKRHRTPELPNKTFILDPLALSYKNPLSGHPAEMLLDLIDENGWEIDSFLRTFLQNHDIRNQFFHTYELIPEFSSIEGVSTIVVAHIFPDGTLAGWYTENADDPKPESVGANVYIRVEPGGLVGDITSEQMSARRVARNDDNSPDFSSVPPMDYSPFTYPLSPQDMYTQWRALWRDIGYLFDLEAYTHDEEGNPRFLPDAVEDFLYDLLDLCNYGEVSSQIFIRSFLEDLIEQNFPSGQSIRRWPKAAMIGNDFYITSQEYDWERSIWLNHVLFFRYNEGDEGYEAPVEVFDSDTGGIFLMAPMPDTPFLVLSVDVGNDSTSVFHQNLVLYNTENGEAIPIDTPFESVYGGHLYCEDALYLNIVDPNQPELVHFIFLAYGHNEESPVGDEGGGIYLASFNKATQAFQFQKVESADHPRALISQPKNSMISFRYQTEPNDQNHIYFDTTLKYTPDTPSTTQNVSCVCEVPKGTEISCKCLRKGSFAGWDAKHVRTGTDKRLLVEGWSYLSDQTYVTYITAFDPPYLVEEVMLPLVLRSQP